MQVQYQTAQAYETKHECYNLLNCEFEEHCKDACFFSDQASYQQINEE